ncbi:peroxisomal targeting signal 2 receptor [Tulasnella sp. 418]|nr:peroxisomal targeting signal 2 receptor [Tulasnella sp. 418]
MFSPHMPSVISTCSTDATVKIFDTRSPQPAFANGTQGTASPAITIPAHGNEVLTIDWNKYRPWLIASAGVDRTIKLWDCRMVTKSGGINPAEVMEKGLVGGTCENTLSGHEYAVRKIQWSPHQPDILASASYDMSCRIWTSAPQAPGRPSLLNIHDTHTEFVVGCAWSLFEDGVIASCSWDHSLHIYRPGF